MADERKPALVKIPSDASRALLNLRDEFPAFRRLMDDILQIVVVLDASAVQVELRWRLGSRINSNARTGLHEAIDSGAVIAVALEVDENVRRIVANGIPRVPRLSRPTFGALLRQDRRFIANADGLWMIRAEA